MYLGSLPADQAKYISTAYSGSTAINARNASASACGMSSCATSAAHDSRKAAPKMANPEATASQWGDRWRPKRRGPIHWSGKRAAGINQSLALIATPSPDPSLRAPGGSKTFPFLCHAPRLALVPKIVALDPLEDAVPVVVQEEQRHPEQREENKETEVLVSAHLRPLHGEEPRARNAADRAHQE